MILILEQSQIPFAMYFFLNFKLPDKIRALKIATQTKDEMFMETLFKRYVKPLKLSKEVQYHVDHVLMVRSRDSVLPGWKALTGTNTSN